MVTCTTSSGRKTRSRCSKSFESTKKLGAKGEEGRNVFLMIAKE